MVELTESGVAAIVMVILADGVRAMTHDADDRDRSTCDIEEATPVHLRGNRAGGSWVMTRRG